MEAGFQELRRQAAADALQLAEADRQLAETDKRLDTFIVVVERHIAGNGESH